MINLIATPFIIEYFFVSLLTRPAKGIFSKFFLKGNNNDMEFY